MISQPSPNNLVAFKRCEAKVKWEVKRAKQNSWRNYCSKITSNTPITQLWKKVKLLRTPFARRSQPLILHDTIVTDPLGKAQALSLHYEKTFMCPAPSPYPQNVVLPLAIALSDDLNLPLNEPFSPYELESSLKSLKHTSPGIDLIHNSHLSHLPNDYKKWLLSIFNQSLQSALIPNSWRLALVVPIPKPAKSLTSVLSYRPISLLSCMGKLLESLINRQLSFFLEQRGSFRASQGGFCRRLSAVDQVARLEAAIRAALAARSTLLVVFCDLSNAFDRVWHTGLLYKLSQCGVQGTLLRWLRAYLTGRTFQVQFEGETSSTRHIRSGVPQGAILSPLLFNVMMRDLPSVRGVDVADYADDVAFFASSHDVAIATARMQSQLDMFYAWTKQWGLTLNLAKTKCMLFTSRQAATIPLSLDGCVLAFVGQYRYLGVVLDAPRLRWEPHINSLKLNCIPIVNLLRSISGRQWGADRILLLKLYKILIRSRLDYGAAFYASAAPTNLEKLNVIQNNCLRIALGCRKTTPISTMEVEANIPPLSVHRKELMCKYYLRLIQLPQCPVMSDLFFANVSPIMPQRTSTLTSFVPHTRSIFSSLQIPVPRLLTSPLISSFPPWFNPEILFSVEFSTSTVSDTSSEAAAQIFQDLVNFKYSSHTAIYTDGSHVSTPIHSTSAAVAIPSRGVLLNWKLRPDVQVIESELFAIKEGLSWSQTNLLQSENIVIFTDSQSSICLIRDRQPTSYLSLIFDIQNKIMSLLPSHEVRIQYVPGHRGIEGNEAADRAANDAHLVCYNTLTPSSKEEVERLLRVRVQASWNQLWMDEVTASGRGRFITLVRDGVGLWRWASHSSRAIETALTRLRTGHAGVRAHLACFNLVNGPLCSCGSPETIEHLLLHCTLHQHARTNLTNQLTRVNVPVTLKNVLGGGPYPCTIQNLIIDAVGSFLLAINVLYTL